MDLKNKLILVTGGAGFVGRHICKKLTDLSANIICIDNLISESALSPDNWPEHLKCNRFFKFIKIDCRDFFKNEIQPHFDYIFHLAAIVVGRNTIENSPLSVGDDLSIYAEMFKCAVKYKPSKILSFSLYLSIFS